jgi:hypothetical protein
VKVKVLKELPQGQQPGEIIDLHPDIVRAFMTPGVDAVELYIDKSEDEDEPTDLPRRRYQRRDLEAKTS